LYILIFQALGVERDAAQKLDIDSIIDKFANTKARVAKFN